MRSLGLGFLMRYGWPAAGFCAAYTLFASMGTIPMNTISSTVRLIVIRKNNFPQKSQGYLIKTSSVKILCLFEYTNILPVFYRKRQSAYVTRIGNPRLVFDYLHVTKTLAPRAVHQRRRRTTSPRRQQAAHIKKTVIMR